MDETTSVRLIEALANIWSKIRLHHPAVPGVLLLPAPASRGRLNVLGHFGALRWVLQKRGDAVLHEVVVVAEHLNRPAAEIAETLLHEAAHAMNYERGLKDCTTSQYHNLKFKHAAEELGLEVKQVLHYGWAFTTLPKETTARYAAEIEALKEVLVHRRSPPKIIIVGTDGKGEDDDTGDDDDPPKGKESRSRKAVCACGFIIRIAKKTFQDTVIVCMTCKQPFQLA